MLRQVEHLGLLGRDLGCVFGRLQLLTTITRIFDDDFCAVLQIFDLLLYGLNLIMVATDQGVSFVDLLLRGIDVVIEGADVALDFLHRLELATLATLTFLLLPL